jgi:hypothetical protein
MKYALLIYGNEVANAKRTEAEQQQEFQDYFAFEGEIAQRNVKQSGEALWDTSKATTIRVRDGKTLTTDGPFAETKEQLGGYYILDCKDLDEAIELAAKIPGAKHGSIEIRPVWEVPAQM